MFYCHLSQCYEEGSEDRTNYWCANTLCGIVGGNYIHPIAQRLIEAATGYSYVRCDRPIDGIMSCLFYGVCLSFLGARRAVIHLFLSFSFFFFFFSFLFFSFPRCS